MVIERVEFDAVAGREEEYLRFAEAHREMIENTPGVRSFTVGRGIEDPSKLILLLGWDSVEIHRASAQAPEYKAFVKELTGFMAGGVTMQHYAIGVAE